MKHSIPFVLAAVLLVPSTAFAAEKIRVVATIPDLADMSRQVGGELVDVRSLATGVEDIHAIPLKPSFAMLLNRADVVVLMGLEAEHAFLPALLDAARNPKILRDQPGYIDCSVLVTPLDVPAKLDRSMGEQHPRGNPHINLDPVLGKDMVRAIADGLSRNFPQHEETFRQNAARYLAVLEEAIARWQRDSEPLRGRKFVSYHSDLLYFATRFGMKPLGTIQLKPGVDATPSHVKELEERMKREGADFVIREVHYPAPLAESISKATGARLVELPVMVGGTPEASDYIRFIDSNLRTLLRAVQDK